MNPDGRVCWSPLKLHKKSRLYKKASGCGSPEKGSYARSSPGPTSNVVLSVTSYIARLDKDTHPRYTTERRYVTMEEIFVPH